MSIIDDYRDKLKKFQDFKELLSSAPRELHEVLSIRTTVDIHIRELEKKIELFTAGKYPYKCSFCQSFIKEEMKFSEIGNVTICVNCSTTIKKVINTNEAEERWELPKGTIKRDIHDGVLNNYIEIGLIFKSGRYWQIHTVVMEMHYEARRKSKEEKLENKVIKEMKTESLLKKVTK